MERCNARKIKTRIAAALAIIVIGASASPAAILVNSTADNTDPSDGKCTLREAITAAVMNTASGGVTGECAAGVVAPAVDTIAFAIPDSDPGCTGGPPKLCTIKPSSTLPQIAEPVLIDGYTQPNAHANTLVVGDDAKILIELDGSNLNPMLSLDGTPVNGGASSSTIRGLALTHVTFNSAIRATHVNHLTVTGNFIGTDASGTTGSGGAQYGIYADSGDAAVIGGTAPADRNVFGGVTSAIFLEGTSNSARETNCVVQGNYIGVDKTGTAALPIVSGIQLRATSNCQIGGSASGAGNVVGSAQQGISVDAEFLNGGCSATTIEGNLVGTDVTGTTPLGQFYGMAIGLSDGTVIGGTGPGQGNVISGNAADGIVVGNTPTNLQIQGNKIGTDFTGQLPLGNGWCGVDVGSGDIVATLGGEASGAANLIAFNGTNGVRVASVSGSTTWTIEGNSIHDNGDLGIVLNGRCDDHSSTSTPNDTNDADSGPNNLQNYPVITTVTIGPKTTAQVSGTLNSTADTKFHIEFFANARCDANGHGEGKVFVGSADVTTIGNNASFGPFGLTVPGCRHVITSTATDPAGNTSEFSKCSDQDTMFTECFEGD